MPDTDGVSLLKEWSTASLLSMPVIMMSGHATIETTMKPPAWGPFLFGKTHYLAKTAESGRARLGQSHPRRQSARQRTGKISLLKGVGEDFSVSLASAEAHAHQGFDLDRPLREARDGFERAYFEFHLAREGGSMTRVAEKPA